MSAPLLKNKLGGGTKMRVYQKVRKGYEENRLLLALIIIVLVFGGGFLATELLRFEVKEDVLRISGLYGTEVKLSDIKSVELKDTLPSNMNRTNGMNLLGMKLLGNFKSNELGKVKMYILSRNKPYLYIALNNGEHVIIRLKSQERTQALFDELNGKQGSKQ